MVDSQTDLPAPPGKDAREAMDLQKWSQVRFNLPPVDSIREIHIYDFDNTGIHVPAQKGEYIKY